MDIIKVLIIDDEHLARELIKSFLGKDDSIKIVGECENGFDGLKAINELKPDLIFLDIMMPKLTGLELLELIDNPPLIIFSTAYDEYAIKAFEKNAVDYLLKPYSMKRFKEAVNKAKQKLSSENLYHKGLVELINYKPMGEEVLSRVVVKTGTKINIIAIEDIRYIEAMDDYVRLHTSGGSFLKQNTMKYYETHLPESDFVRIHRSFIVRVKEIARLESMEKDAYVALLDDGTQLSVSRSGYGRLRSVLGL
ncbi:MAG: two-component system LytT family response regulator [Cyclobacteriaceae bacterium]|jgi:two-component system LytT family response regulator